MIVYICGPLTMGGSELRAELLTERIETAELVAAALMMMGESPVLTHPVCRHQVALDAVSQRRALDACRELIAGSGAMACIEGWERSGGCMAEVLEAYAHVLPFVGPDLALHDEPAPWTRADALRVLGVE